MNKGARFQAFVRNWGNCLLELVISQNRLLMIFLKRAFPIFRGAEKKRKKIGQNFHRPLLHRSLRFYSL